MWKRVSSGLLVVVLLLSISTGAVTAQSPDDEDAVTVENDLIARMAESMEMTREELLRTLLDGQTFREVMDQQDVTLRQVMDRSVMLRRGRPPVSHPEVLLDILSDVLDMEPEAIREALEGGQTLADLIEAQGLDEDAVIDALKTDAIERINQAVEDSKLDAERAKAMIARIEEHDLETLLNRDFAPTPPMPRIGLEVLAEALGMSEDDLRAALEDGQTVPELIEAEGFSVEAVADDLKAAIVSRVELAVADGKVKEENADEMLEKLEDSDVIEDWLAGEAPFPGSRGGVANRVRKWLESAPSVLRFLHRRFPRLRRTPVR
jgi:sulfur carrier protein ThiS